MILRAPFGPLPLRTRQLQPLSVSSLERVRGLERDRSSRSSYVASTDEAPKLPALGVSRAALVRGARAIELKKPSGRGRYPRPHGDLPVRPREGGAHSRSVDRTGRWSLGRPN